MAQHPIYFDNHRCTFQINYCMQLMWWTLARPSEVAEAQWSEIDLDRAQWRIPAERMKARKEHVVPLPTQAVEMLRGLKAITGQRKHLFRLLHEQLGLRRPDPGV